MWAARTEATNAGTPCCGSPTAKLIGDLPGSLSPKSSRSRTKGERPTSARTGEGGETRSAAVMNIDKAAPAPAAPGMSYHRCGEVKARLTNAAKRHRHERTRDDIIYMTWLTFSDIS